MSEKDHSIADLVIDLRKFVGKRLDNKSSPQDLSYALAYVATEMGLHFTDDSTTVFPVVLRAVSQAVDARQAQRRKHASVDKEDCADLETMPVSETLH